MSAEQLSAVQMKVLNAIRQYVQENDCPPTVREIQEAAGLSGPSHVHYHLGVLEKKGYIQRTADVSRGIEVVADVEARRRAGLINIPVIGTIAAGEPIQAIQVPEDLFLTRDVAKAGDYALRVRGDSMILDHIESGDLVVVKAQDTADDGDTVVALLLEGAGDPVGEATLKRLYHEPPGPDGKGGRIRLQPRNDGMPPIYVDPDHLRIQGKVVGVIRLLT